MSDWPAMAYVYGTWGYALDRALAFAAERHLKQHVYQGTLNDELVWVVSWDPKSKTLKKPEVGDWAKWSKSLSSQVLSKQDPELGEN